MFAPADHTVACQANALICAVENLRDTEGMTPNAFRLGVMRNEVMRQADSYLDHNSGMMPDVCKCHVKYVLHVRTVFVHEGSKAATELAMTYLNDGQISPERYIGLVKWSEGRYYESND